MAALSDADARALQDAKETLCFGCGSPDKRWPGKPSGGTHTPQRLRVVATCGWVAQFVDDPPTTEERHELSRQAERACEEGSRRPYR